MVQVNNGHKEATRLDFDLVPVTEVSEEEKDANAWMMYNDVLSQQVTLFLKKILSSSTSRPVRLNLKTNVKDANRKYHKDFLTPLGRHKIVKNKCVSKCLKCYKMNSG